MVFFFFRNVQLSISSVQLHKFYLLSTPENLSSIWFSVLVLFHLKNYPFVTHFLIIFSKVYHVPYHQMHSNIQSIFPLTFTK